MVCMILKQNIQFELLMKCDGSGKHFCLLRNLGSSQGALVAAPSMPLTEPCVYSKKEYKSNNVFIHCEEFSSVHNSDRSSNATQSILVYKNV